MICKFIDCIIDNSIQTYGRPQGGGGARVGGCRSLEKKLFTLWGAFLLLFSPYGGLFTTLSPYGGPFFPCVGPSCYFFLYVGAFFGPYGGPFLALPPFYENFCGRPCPNNIQQNGKIWTLF